VEGVRGRGGLFRSACVSVVYGWVDDGEGVGCAVYWSVCI